MDFESDESYEMESEEEDKILAGQISSQNHILHNIRQTITKLSKAIEFNRQMKIESDEKMATKFVHTVQRRHEGRIDGLREDFEYIPTSGEEDDSEADDSASENLRLLSDKSTPLNHGHSKPYSHSSQIKHKRMRLSIHNNHDDNDLQLSDIEMKGLRKNHKSVHEKRNTPMRR